MPRKKKTTEVPTPADSELKSYKTEFLLERLNNKNPRWMADDQREALNASLNKFGCVEPLIFNTKTQRVVGGHQRIISSASQGIEELPVREVCLDDDEELALNIFLNKVRGQWDYQKTAAYLQKLSPDAIAVTGFSLTESNTLIQSFLSDTEIDDEEIDTQANAVVNQLRNLTEEESQEELASETYVQFGQFSLKVPTPRYEAWVAKLIAESDFGVSPFGLGQVVAKRLGILDAVSENGKQDESEEIGLFIGSPDDEEDDEELGILKEAFA